MTEQSNRRLDENITVLLSMTSSKSDNNEKSDGSEAEISQIVTDQTISDSSPESSQQTDQDITDPTQNVENSPFYFLMAYARKPDTKPTLPENIEQI